MCKQSVVLLLVLMAGVGSLSFRTVANEAAVVERYDAEGSRKEQPLDESVARQLDSLASLSVGDYVHLRIGPCATPQLGRVSLYSLDGSAYRYSAALWNPWMGDGPNPDDQRADYALPGKQAVEMFGNLDAAGLRFLVPDSTLVVPDLCFFSLRARIGEKVITIDDAYLGGKKYYNFMVTGEINGRLLERFYLIRSILFAGWSGGT